jgi:DNA-binding transcriptional LysR family regulator
MYLYRSINLKFMNERFKATTDVWNWLPAFRAVAETEHLPTAGEMMNVTPPALSRAVRQLEEAVGRELFVRSGRSITLNEDGRRLAIAVRMAMRTVHTALEELAEERFQGLFRWTSTWSMSSIIVDVLADVLVEHPRLMPQMHPIGVDDTVARLLRGELDLAVTMQPVDITDLVSVRLGTIPHSVYCGPTHALFGKENVPWSDFTEHRFAAPVATASGTFDDGWPKDQPRNVAMQFAQMEVGYQACQSGRLLAVLPDNVARGLWPLKAIDSAPSAYAVHRRSETPGPAEAVAAGLVASFGDQGKPNQKG